jgi:hypothetical protein
MPGDTARMSLGDLRRFGQRAVAPQCVPSHVTMSGIRHEAGRAGLVEASVQGPDRQQQRSGGEPMTTEVGAGQHPVGVRTTPEGVSEPTTGVSAAAVATAVGADEQQRIGVQSPPLAHGSRGDDRQVPACHDLGPVDPPNTQGGRP